jgi:hypothetical protein
MALVTAQLLFLERLDPDTVVLDLIVLDRADEPASPPVGAPLAFGFALPSDQDERAEALVVLGNWADRGAAVEIDLRARGEIDEIVLRSDLAGVVLHPAVRGTAGSQ